MQDRDGARLVLKKIRRRYSSLSLIWADGGYAGQLVKRVAKLRRPTPLRLEIVKRTDDMKGFVVLPRRWVVERTFAWLGRHRRLSKDYEQLVLHSTALIYIAMLGLMLRRVASAF